jgi:hypothetical protein
MTTKLAQNGTYGLSGLIPPLPLIGETQAKGLGRSLVAAPPPEPPISTKRVKLPQYKPQNRSEIRALRNLRIAWGSQKSQKQFYKLVQGHLALIGDVYSRSNKPKPVRTLQYVRRTAKRCRDFAAKIEISRPKGLLYPFPPTRELLLYAQNLDSVGERIVARKKERVLRHNTHKESREILDLLRFVRDDTGEPHYMDVAILLRGATDDQGITSKRLESLWRNHFGKRRRHTFFRRAFPSRRNPYLS